MTEVAIPIDYLKKFEDEDRALGVLIGDSLWRNLVYEFVGTFFLVLSYYLIILNKNSLKSNQGAAMGAAYLIVTIFLFKKSGADYSLFKVAIFSIVNNPLKDVWVFIVGDLSGLALASFVGELLLSESSTEFRERIQKKEKELDRNKPINGVLVHDNY